MNDMPVKMNCRVRTDDDVTFYFPKAVEPDIQPQDIFLDILYGDDGMLVVTRTDGFHMCSGMIADYSVPRVKIPSFSEYLLCLCHFLSITSVFCCMRTLNDTSDNQLTCFICIKRR